MPRPVQGAVGFQGLQGPATTPTAKPQDPRGGSSYGGVIDQSPNEGFPTPPTIATHPTAINVVGRTHTGYGSGVTAPMPDESFAPAISGPLTPWHQAGITPPKGTAPTDPQFGVSQEQINAMQASQRAMKVIQVAPSLKTHPEIVAALAYNNNIPFNAETIKLIAAVQKARSAINYASRFTMDDYNQTARLVDPQAFAHESMPARIGRGFAEGYDSVSRFFSGDAQTGPRLSPLSYDSNVATLRVLGKAGHAVSVGAGASVETRIEDLPDGITVKARPNGSLEYFDKNGKPLSSSEAAFIDLNIAGTTGTLTAAAGSPGKVIVNPSVVAKAVMNFVADQFDTPEHLYRYIATVQHKHGSGYAFLALLPTLIGAVAGGALGGLGSARGAELGLAAEEALTNSFVNEGLSDLAASTLAKRSLADMQERASVIAAQRAAQKGEFVGKFGNVVTFPVKALSKVATSPISLGADAGFTGSGQMLYRQDYMDSRDGTEWAKKYPMLASTFGRYATQNMDAGGWKTFLSGALDAIAAVAVPDALGSTGRVVGIARSAEGFTGGLLSGKYKDTGNWFGNVYDKYGGISRDAEGGLRIGGIYRTGTRLSNIDASYNESAGVRRTVNLIAQMGNAGEVIGVDARFAPIADLLAKARVLNADGTVDMTKSVENVKQVLRDSQTASELMERPLSLTNMPVTASAVYRDIRAGIQKVAPEKLKSMAAPLPLYPDLKTLKMENREITVGNRDALPAIRDMIAGEHGYQVANIVVDELAKNPNPRVWQRTLLNMEQQQMAVILAKRMDKANIPDVIKAEMLKKYDRVVSNAYEDIFNFGGPNTLGSYGFAVWTGEGSGSRDLSRIKQRIEEAPEPSAGTPTVAKMENPANWKDAIDNAAARGDRKLVTRLEKRRAEEIQEGLLSDLDKDIADKGYPEFSKHAQGSAEEMATELGKFKAHQEAVAANKAAAIKRNKTWTGWDQIKQKLQDQGSLTRITGTESLPAETTALLTQFAKNVGEDLFNDVKLTYSAKTDSVLGSFDFANAVIKLYPKAIEKGGEDFVRTAFHEFYHNLTRFTPESFVGGIEKSLVKGREKFLKENPELKGILDPSTKVKWDETLGSRKLKEIIAKAHPELDKDGVKDLIRKHFRELTDGSGNIVGYQWNMRFDVMANYRLTNTDEHFAERMADMARSRFKLPEEGGIWQSIQEAFRKLLGAVQAVIGQKGMRRLFEQFNNGKYSGSEMVREFGFAGGKTKTAKSISEVGDSVPSPDPLAGANHNLTDVVNPLTEQTVAGAIVPEEIGKMRIPSYLELDRLQKGFVDDMEKIYKETINVEPDIIKLQDSIIKLQDDITKATDPALITKLQARLKRRQDSLTLKQAIGAAVPKDMPDFGYKVWRNGLAMAKNSYDLVDHYYNDMFFKRSALATGGWAMRTGMSEAALNIMRQGPLNYTAARLAASTARHERAVLHVGEKFTRQAAEDIAARIYHVIKEDKMLTNGQVFGTEQEMHAAVASVRQIANEANYTLGLKSEDIIKALQQEERDTNRLLTKNVATAKYRGFMVGLKSQIVKQLNKQDLLDSAIRLMYLNDGHIVSPMLNATHAGIVRDIQTGSIAQDQTNAATWGNPLITKNRKLQKAKLSKDYQTSDASNDAKYAGNLQARATWMSQGKVYGPVFEKYQEAYVKAKTQLEAAGVEPSKISSAAAELAADEIRPFVDDLLMNLPEAERSALLRTTHPLPDHHLYSSRQNPQYSGLSAEEHAALTDEEHAAIDHTTAAIRSAEGLVRFADGQINEALLKAVAEKIVPQDLERFSKQMMELDGKKIELGMFNSIPGPGTDYANYNVVEQFFAGTLGKFTDWTHRKALGPIVNRLTRDPIYIIDFAAERKLLNAQVTAGELTRDEADAIAQARASVNAMKYIHNPKNKLKFENMMRLWAPFYFAENQAWRRLGRLAWTNPGAVEQYTKAMYGAQQAAYQYDQKNNNLAIPIPGSAWLNKHFYTGVAMPLELSPNSLRTVFPWSAEAGQAPGVGSLIDSFLPKSGPILSIPGNLYLQKFAGFAPALDEVLSKYIVGQAGLGQPTILSLFPNSIFANIAKGIIGAATANDKGQLNQSLLGTSASSYISANIMVQTALLDDMQEKAWNLHKNDAVPDVWKTYGITQREYAMLAMMSDIEEQFQNPDARQKFLDTANQKTAEIWLAKTLVGATSPMSTLIGRANLQYSTEFQAEIKKTGSVLAAANALLKKHPYITAETLFTTVSTNDPALGVSWPTAPGTSKFMLDNKADIVKYPAAMRFALEEGPQLAGKSGYDQMAHFLQTSWGLRAQRSPKGFFDAYLGAVFNQFHYGVLQPMAQELKKRGYSSTEINNVLLHNSVTWKSRQNDPSKWSILEQFGKETAPLAFDQYLTGQSAINRASALQQLRVVTAMPEMVAKYPNFKAIRDELLPSADALIKTQEASVGNSEYRDKLAVLWNSYLDEQATSNPNLLPVIQQIFRPLAPIFPN